MLQRYWTTACKTCALKSKCTPGPERRVVRREPEAVLEAVHLAFRDDTPQFAGTSVYRSGPSKTWLKIKNPAAPGVQRFVRDEDG
jgi:hypothetical protein